MRGSWWKQFGGAGCNLVRSSVFEMTSLDGASRKARRRSFAQRLEMESHAEKPSASVAYVVERPGLWGRHQRR